MNFLVEPTPIVYSVAQWDKGDSGNIYEDCFIKGDWNYTGLISTQRFVSGVILASFAVSIWHLFVL